MQYISCSNIVVDDLVKQGARTSAATLLTELAWNAAASAPETLNYTNPGYGLSLVDTLWNAGSYR